MNPLARTDSWVVPSGEQGPTMIIDHCLSAHKLNQLANGGDKGPGNGVEMGKKDSPSEGYRRLIPPRNGSGGLSYGAVYTPFGLPHRTLRFQVVIWYVGEVDVAQGRVPMQFRITMFWNDHSSEDVPKEPNVPSAMQPMVWQMQGRRKAIKRTMSGLDVQQTVDVPAVSILNVVNFDIIGNAEVAMLREDTKLMRWTCLYRATLIMENMRVDSFPHDKHDLYLKLGILANRRKGSRWDKDVWKLALATEDDSQSSTRIPHGLIVDHVSIPDFNYSKEAGLTFEFKPLSLGRVTKGEQDEYLKVRLTVLRDSGYYDYNIMPILALLQVVVMSILCLPATKFFNRALLLLNIAFVEIGIRMTVDSHLPSVGYQIKMQRILNQFFAGILFIVLESAANHVLLENEVVQLHTTHLIDLVVGLIAVVHLLYTVSYYYWDMYRANKNLGIEWIQENEADSENTLPLSPSRPSFSSRE